MGSADAPGWTLSFCFCRQDGRSISGMANIGQCGLVGRWFVSSWETRNDPGGGVSPWWGGDIIAPALKNKPAWVSPVADSRRPGWSPSVQAYPPLGSQRTLHSPESIEGADRRPRRPAQPNMEQIDPDIRIVPERDLPSPLTPVSGARWVGRNMWPAGQNDKSPCSLNRNNMVTDKNTNEVAGTGNSDVHPRGGHMSGLQLQGGVMGFHPERVSSTVAAEAVFDVNEWEVDAIPLLSVTGMNRSPIIAGVATLAVTKITSSTNFAADTVG